MTQTGAKVFITARQVEKAQHIADSISTNPARPPISVLELSLDSFDSVKAAAESFLSQSKTLNILVTNAGVMACPEGQTKDGFETHFGTNHLGHFLLFQLLKPTLLASATPSSNSRVVSLSTSGHHISNVHFDNYSLKGEYDPWVAYGQSKTANIYFANEISRRYGSKGLQAFSVHPGAITDTELGRHVRDDEFLKGMLEKPELQRERKTTEQGVATQVWAALAKSLEGKGGLYLADTQVSKPDDETATPWGPHYAPYAYDEAAEKRLWVDSLKMVGIDDDL